MKRSRFAVFAWVVLAYNLAVILWGAFVRATGSGAGCGGHWPTCDGVMLPVLTSTAMRIELFHRMTSGLTLLLAIGLAIWGLRAYPRGSAIRRGALAVLLITLIEALLGAVLVRFNLVAKDGSAARAAAMSIHLINTFLLLAAYALTAWWASGGKTLRLRGQGAVSSALSIGLAGLLILGVTGAIAALGDTLFPSRSLFEGLQRDVDPTAHFLIRARAVHPFLAASVGVYLLLAAGLVTRMRPGVTVRRAGAALGSLVMCQVALGLINVMLLAPTSLQLAHLLLADLVWIAFVIFAAAALADRLGEQAEGRGRAPRTRAPEGAARAAIRDYVALTKPRIISLLLFTALAAMFIAAGGWPGGWVFVAVAVGGYASAGAANAINMVIDSDIDRRMARTADRPTVAHRISPTHAMLFAFGLIAFSIVVLWVGANLLSAILAQVGLLVYVFVYTLGLKRRTWHNIVIGGAAGAFPPLVGWAAVTGNLSAMAWCLFAIIFLWTPVHFWALALIIKDDYAAAGIPMAPVVLGDRMTVLQIAVYAVLTAAISLYPVIEGQAGVLYLVIAGLLNVVLLVRSVHLCRSPQRPQARALFLYSMVYLALLFLVMAADRSFFAVAAAGG